MKNLISLILIFFICDITASNKIIYLDPVPDANYVNTNNNIILGFEQPVTLSKNEILSCIDVIGSLSGKHSGSVVLSSDNSKIVFKSSSPFKFNEKVSIELTGKLLQILKRNEYKFSFNTSCKKAEWDYVKSIRKEFHYNETDLPLPPQFIVTIDDNPAEGYFFTAPWSSGSDLMITNNNGMTYWYCNYFYILGDFKKQPNANLTYFNGLLNKHLEMDADYNVIDTFYCGNGYTTDIHELKVLSNGHALVMAYDPEIVDMRQYVEGGDSTATVIGLIIQEVDENNNVVFQWRSWDHFQITDATHENLLDSVIDYVHGNAIEPDADGNLMISSRHLDEITKINRATGAIIWRLGGKNNQFTFINDNIRFSHQHDIRRISNGNITLYDNGNFHTPHFSRAVEYSLDENNKTATLVWQFRHTPDVFGSWGGNVQRLPGGNTIIAWGGANVTITEVKPNGITAFEGSYPLGVYSYRGYKFDWGTPLVINTENNGVPKSYTLYHNYPNPFNPQTTISFDIPEGSQTQLVIFDITGREVNKAINEFLKAGSYKFTFDGSGLSSGLYIYRLRAGDFTGIGKMILIK